MCSATKAAMFKVVSHLDLNVRKLNSDPSSHIHLCPNCLTAYRKKMAMCSNTFCGDQ